MRAREFLAQEKGDDAFELRNLIKEPLTATELRRIARRAGGAAELVAPKKRKEAEGLDGEELITWLAEDGSRVRRPIIVAGDVVTLGFGKDTPATLRERGVVD